MKKQEKQTRKPAVLMPGGKYVNMPVNKVNDAWVLLWNLSPKPLARLTPDQVHAIWMQAGKLLRANDWQLPEPNEMQAGRMKAAKEKKAKKK